jgi:RNA polymerase sigma-70 factor (ECF subfamily)
MLAVTLLPMAPSFEPPRVEAQDRGSKRPAAGQAYPKMVSATPEPGATAVDPGLNEITVKFDRDMGKGMSWTGGQPLFPPLDRSRQARWTDARTCVLPVRLEMGTYYRLGINSSSNQNFRSSDGVPAPPAVIYFATMGASMETSARVRTPEIEKLEPENGAMDVDPATKALRVTFSVPMGEGISWTGGGPQFPKLVPGKGPTWSSDRRTCTLPVALEPGHNYELWLNSLSHINFQSEWGVPLEPVEYKFRTRGAGE